MAEFVFADDHVLESSKTRDFYVRFLKDLVHKYNNLAGVIQGFSSLTLLDDTLSENLRENIGHMDSAARLMADLNKIVLASSGCGKVDCMESSLQGMFGFQEDKAGTICREHGVKFQFETDPDLPPVILDTTKFSEVFEALVRNAAESAAETKQKSVAIEVHKPGDASATDHVDIFISNSSLDFPAPKLAEFFEGFNSSKSNDHFGLGLTLAAVLCGQMNIRLGLKCRDAVTTAWLSVPVAK